MLIQHSWRSMIRGEAMYDQRSRHGTVRTVITNTILGLILIATGIWLTVVYLAPAIVSQW